MRLLPTAFQTTKMCFECLNFPPRYQTGTWGSNRSVPLGCLGASGWQCWRPACPLGWQLLLLCSSCCCSWPTLTNPRKGGLAASISLPAPRLLLMLHLWGLSSAELCPLCWSQPLLLWWAVFCGVLCPGLVPLCWGPPMTHVGAGCRGMRRMSLQVSRARRKTKRVPCSEAIVRCQR